MYLTKIHFIVLLLRADSRFHRVTLFAKNQESGEIQSYPHAKLMSFGQKFPRRIYTPWAKYCRNTWGTWNSSDHVKICMCIYLRSSLLIGFFSNIWSSWSLQLSKHLITRHLSWNCQFCQYVSPFISATMSFRWIRRCVISFPWRFLRWYLYCLLTVHLDKVYSSLLENGKMYLTQFNVFIKKKTPQQMLGMCIA